MTEDKLCENCNARLTIIDSGADLQSNKMPLQALIELDMVLQIIWVAAALLFLLIAVFYSSQLELFLLIMFFVLAIPLWYFIFLSPETYKCKQCGAYAVYRNGKRVKSRYKNRSQ